MRQVFAAIFFLAFVSAGFADDAAKPKFTSPASWTLA